MPHDTSIDGGRGEGQTTTHYLGEPGRALCGEADPIMDLGPFNGAISCEHCIVLWDQGYSLWRRPPTELIQPEPTS